MTQSSKIDPRQVKHLLIDADDTLWENNIYFEHAIEDFLDFLDHSSLTRSGVREVLDGFERVNAPQHGYGSAVFTRSLEDTFRHLVEREIAESDIETVVQFGRRILDQELELIPHVETTLAHLNRTYVLTMCTKGDLEEQQIKIDRSGLARYFHQIEIMSEKDTGMYAAVLDRLGAVAAETCMIGNSPRSDINPPLELGMSAIFIPHDHTWQLEHQEVDRSHPKLMILDRFADLLDYF